MTENPLLQPGKSPSAVPPGDLVANAALRLALVAGSFLLVAVGLLAWNYSQRLVKDPLNAEQFQALKAQLAANPQDEELKAQIREMDRILRSQYFAQRRFASAGAWIILGGVAVALALLRGVATLRRPLPHPETPPPSASSESESARAARWAVAGLGAVLALAGLVLAIGVGTVVPDDGEAGSALATTASVESGQAAVGREKAEPESPLPAAAGQAQGPAPKTGRGFGDRRGSGSRREPTPPLIGMDRRGRTSSGSPASRSRATARPSSGTIASS